MGFVYKSFYVTTGSEEFPVGDTDVLRLSRSQTLLTKCAQALIACNVGWQLDTNRNATDTSYVSVPDISGNYTYPGLFFRNTISGCKLFMAYFGGNVIYNGIKDFGGDSLVYAANAGKHGGLCVSMIPAGSASEFGDPTQSTFLPADATRICGTCYFAGSTNTGKWSAAYNPTSGWIWMYAFLATPYCICVSSHHSSNGTVPGLYVPVYACGRILGTIVHGETTTNAKYGVLCFRVLTYDYEQWVEIFEKSLTPIRNSLRYPWCPRGSSIPTSGYSPGGAICRSDGTWISGSCYNSDGTQTVNVCFYTTDIWQPEREYSFTSSLGTRWSSIAMIAVSSGEDKSVIEIVPGTQNGFKGYLDTDLFRCGCSGVSRGSTFDNGKWIVLENSCGWFFGWEPGNDSIGELS